MFGSSNYELLHSFSPTSSILSKEQRLTSVWYIQCITEFKIWQKRYQYTAPLLPSLCLFCVCTVKQSLPGLSGDEGRTTCPLKGNFPQICSSITDVCSHFSVRKYQLPNKQLQMEGGVFEGHFTNLQLICM